MLANLKPKKFEEINNFIIENEKKLNQEHAVAILIWSCNICVQDSEETTSIYLKSTLKKAFSLISDLNEKQLQNYVQTVYHIAKCLTDKKLFDVIIQIEDVIWPPFVLQNLSVKLKNIYINLCKVFSNAIAVCAFDSNLNYGQILLKLDELSRKISSKVLDPLTYLTQSTHSVINLSKLNLSESEYKDHFIYILLQIERREVNNDDLKFYQPLLTCCALVIQYTLMKSNFEKTERFYIELRETVKKIFNTQIIISNLFDPLKLPIILSPTEEGKLEQLCKYSCYLEDFIKSELREYQAELGNKLHMILVTVMNFYTSKAKNQWANFSEDLQLEILRFIYKISKLESETPFKCACGCSVNLNRYRGFRTCQIITSFLMILFTDGRTLNSSFHRRIVEIYSKFGDKNKYLRDNQCVNWKTTWNMIATEVYNLGVTLYKKQDVNACYYFYFLLRNYMLLKEKHEKIIKNTVLLSTLQGICSLYSKDYKKCLAFCALGIFLCEEQRESFMCIWINTKHKLKGQNDEVQVITLVEAFRKFSAELNPVICSIDFLKEEDEIKLLTFELEQYKKRWKSRLPTITVVEELVKRMDTVDKKVEVFAKSFIDSDLLFHENVFQLANTILTDIEAEELNAKMDLHLPILYFLNYKFYMSQTILKHADEVEQALKIKPVESTVDRHKDPNEECDIVSTYENLHLDKYLINVKYLDLSLTVIQKNMQEVLKHGDRFRVYELLLRICYEYMLMDNRLQVIKAVSLALKIAQKENEPTKIVHCASFLIERSNVKKRYIKELISTADKIVENIEKSASVTQIILIYYLSKAKAFLYENAQESFKCYTTASNILNGRNTSEDFGHFRCQLLLLKLKYISMSCDVIPELHDGNFFNVALSISAFYEEFRHWTDDAYKMATLLETNEAIAEFYNRLQCPREVRLYCREILILTQKMLLPLRCCTYLTYLSQADLYSKKFDDCRVKLNGMADILSFAKMGTETPTDDTLKSDFEFKSLIKDLENIHIDENDLQMSTSPIFSRENSKLPQVSYHEKTCDCFFCNCFEYQNLVMEKIRLEAKLNLKQKNFETAKKIFDNGLQLQKFFSEKSKLYTEVNSMKFHSDLIPDPTDESVQSYGQLLLDFTKFLMKLDKKISAEVVNGKLLKLLEPWKRKYLHLYNNVLLHKWAILRSGPKFEIPPSSTEETTEQIIKTPEQKESKVSVTVQKISPCSPIFKIPLKKRLEFELSPENNNNKKQECSETSKQTPCRKELPSTGKRGTSRTRKVQSKTPAPKIKIYTEEEDKDITKKGRVTRTRAAAQKKGGIFEDDLPQTSQLKNVRRTYLSKKNLLGELEELSAKNKK